MKKTTLYMGLGIPLVLLFAHCSYYLGWTIDDPYISYRYAENLVAGHGLVFNPGERVEGYSNFLFVLILAGFRAIGFSPVWVSRFIGFLSVLAIIPLLFKTLAREDISAHPLLRFFPLYFLALNGSLALWSVSGMETGFYTLLVTLAWYLLVQEDKARISPVAVSVLFLLVALTRPEGILFFGVCFLGDLYRAVRSRDSHLFKRLVVRCIPIGAGFLIYNLWRIGYYNALFPNTFYAKATGQLVERLGDGVVYLAAWGFENSVVIPLMLFIPFLTHLRLHPPIKRAAEFTIAGVIFILYSGGDWMPMWRFIVPILPVVAFLIGRGLVVLWQGIKECDPDYYRRDFVMIMVALLLVFGLWRERKLSFPIMSSVREGSFYRPNIRTAAWLEKHASPSAVVAGEEAGIIPYYSELYFIDMIGIVDTHIARLEGGLHEKTDPEYVLSNNPDFVVLICTPAEPATEEPEPLFRSGAALMETDEFTSEYSPVASFPRGNKYLGKTRLVIFKRES